MVGETVLPSRNNAEVLNEKYNHRQHIEKRDKEMRLITRCSCLNSLWSIIYCFVVLAAHLYITYLGITKYQKLNNDELWGGESPRELRTYLALFVLSALFLPLFVFFSFLKVGNAANDGIKLGRDHALDSSNNVLGARITCTRLWCIWEHFLPVSSVFHLLSAFLLLIPEVICTALQIKRGLMSSDMVWTCDLDFLFDSDRAATSNIISQSNITVQSNMSFYVVPTPRPPVDGSARYSTLHVAFAYMAAGLLMFVVRYAAVLWFTNKTFSAIFATQLLFMTVHSLFSHCGIEILYKLSSNFEKYEGNINITLKPAVILYLYIVSGIVLLFSTFFVFTYGASYFQDKFKIIDKRHHPEAYTKQTVIVNGSCQDYKTHTAAVISLVLIGILKGPIIYDLVTLYRDTKDSMVFSCIVIDVCYMIFWIVLWTILTLKQQWQFRILDYVPLSQPVFIFSNYNIDKRALYYGGSIGHQQHRLRKRPRSLPSDLASSESGFGDVNSSEDEKERFEISLPPLIEDPTNLKNSRRKGSIHSLDRRNRRRRNGNQRVTFHDIVKRNASANREPYLTRIDCKRELQAAAGVSCVAIQPGFRERLVSPIELEVLQMHKPGCRHSIGTTPCEFMHGPLNIFSNKQSSSFSDIGRCLGSRNDRHDILIKSEHSSDKGPPSQDLLIANDYAYSVRLYVKNPNNDAGCKNSAEIQARPQFSDNNTVTSPVKDSNKSCLADIKEDSVLNSTHLIPNSLEFIDKKQINLVRRDSANYSLTSSQETASNGSDHVQQALCSQV